MRDKARWRSECEKHRRTWIVLAALMVVVSPFPVIGQGPFRIPAAVLFSLSGVVLSYRAGVGYANTSA